MVALEPPLRIDEKIRQLILPELISYGSVPLTEHDCLVVCSGFEERAMAVLKEAIRSGCSGFSLINIDYLPRYQENQHDLVVGLCQANNLHITQLVYDRQNPAGMGKAILEASMNCRRLFIDISGMSRLLITQVLVELAQEPERYLSASLFYTEAEMYPPTKQEFDADCAQSRAAGRTVDSYISSGVHEVAITPELSSVAMHAQAIRMVAFPSFNREQLVVLLQEIQPAFVNLIDGLPPRQENLWRVKAIQQLNDSCVRSLAHDVEQVEVSTLDYRETLNYLLQVYERHGDSDKIVIAPTGSKMQSVAVGLFRAFMRDIQIVYPTPQTFSSPERHTQGIRCIYRLDLAPFASVT
jgi:hypothetical protein